MRFADAWVMMPVLAKDDLVPRRPDDPLSRSMAKWFHRQSDQMDQGSTITDVIAEMDACGIEKALLSRAPLRVPSGEPPTRGVRDHPRD